MLQYLSKYFINAKLGDTYSILLHHNFFLWKCISLDTFEGFSKSATSRLIFYSFIKATVLVHWSGSLLKFLRPSCLKKSAWDYRFARKDSGAIYRAMHKNTSSFVSITLILKQCRLWKTKGNMVACRPVTSASGIFLEKKFKTTAHSKWGGADR